MGQQKEIKIKRPHLIMCEGRDAERYLIYFLQPLIIADDRFDKFQVEDVGGINELPRFVKTLPLLPKFSTVLSSLTIIRDAEKNAQGASQSIQRILRDNNFATPIKPCCIASPTKEEHSVKVSYALFPKFALDDENGTLEDLCLNTLNLTERRIRDIAYNAVTQMKTLKRPHKNTLHVCLSLTDEFVGLKIGESAKANAFNFAANDLAPLRALLYKMLE